MDGAGDAALQNTDNHSLNENSNVDSQNLEASEIKLDAVKSKSPAGSRGQPISSTPKPGGVTRPATLIESSAISEGGDESFVVQVDDMMLNEIDADLLDSTQGDVRAAESAGNSQGGVGDKKQGGAVGTGQGSLTTSGASSKSAENTDTKGSSKTTSKEEKDTKSVAKRFVLHLYGKFVVKSAVIWRERKKKNKQILFLSVFGLFCFC